MKKLVLALCLLTSPAFAQQAAHRTTIVVAATNNLTTIKGTGGLVFGWSCETIVGSAAMWLKFFDGAPTMGTTAAVDNIGLLIAGPTISPAFAAGVQYNSTITVAITAGQALTNNTSAVAGAGTCTIYWN